MLVHARTYTPTRAQKRIPTHASPTVALQSFRVSLQTMGHHINKAHQGHVKQPSVRLSKDKGKLLHVAFFEVFDHYYGRKRIFAISLVKNCGPCFEVERLCDFFKPICT